MMRLIKFLLGLTVGAAVGVLLAPKSGREMRQQLLGGAAGKLLPPVAEHYPLSETISEHEHVADVSVRSAETPAEAEPADEAGMGAETDVVGETTAPQAAPPESLAGAMPDEEAVAPSDAAWIADAVVFTETLIVAESLVEGAEAPAVATEAETAEQEPTAAVAAPQESEAEGAPEADGPEAVLVETVPQAAAEVEQEAEVVSALEREAEVEEPVSPVIDEEATPVALEDTPEAGEEDAPPAVEDVSSLRVEEPGEVSEDTGEMVAEPAEPIAAPPQPAGEDLLARIEQTRAAIEADLAEPFSASPEAPAGASEALDQEAAAVPEPAAEGVGLEQAQAGEVETRPADEAPAAVPVGWIRQGNGLVAAIVPPAYVEAPSPEAPEPVEEPTTAAPVISEPEPIVESPSASEPIVQEQPAREPAAVDQAEMRRRIEETRARLKAKAFDAMMSGESALLRNDSGDRPVPRDAHAKLEPEIDSTIDESLSQEDL